MMLAGQPRWVRDADAASPAPRTLGGARGLGVRLAGLCRGFAGRAVLRNVDLSIEPGQFVAIVGRSGSGKSTLLRILAGLDQADAGTALLGGAPARPGGDTRIMFQDGRLLPWRRVIDNVDLGLPAASRPRAEAALRAVGLADRAGDWPRVLSGGQKQRVALARALAADPRLVLLDEPLGALDALTRLEMQALIETVWQRGGFTAVLVTHDVAEAALLADRILLIVNGAIAMDIAVDLPRPRRAGAALAAVEEAVLGRILGKEEGVLF
jgi:sulfonate transport system ATP-binding protein